MKLKDTFIDAKRLSRKKIFNKADQIEMAWLEHRIMEIGFVPFNRLYIAEEVHKFATIAETKGKLKRRFQKAA